MPNDESANSQDASSKQKDDPQEIPMPEDPAFIEPEPILWLCLGTKRANGSRGIDKIRAKIIELAPNDAIINVDANGILWVDLRAGTSKTMFAAHMDTVEQRGQEGTFKLEINRSGMVYSEGHKHIIGADDGAGVAILVSLMQARIPALYFFSVGEECGGVPALLALSNPLLDGLDRCIAFDRRGQWDIVADQAKGILASHDFVDALSKQLGMDHKWSTGSYTDSSEFHLKIKEIVNVSIGYVSNHMPSEQLNYAYFKKLRQACLKVDWESLPCVGPDKTKAFRYGYNHPYQGSLYNGEDEYWGFESRLNWPSNKKHKNGKIVPLAKIIDKALSGINGIIKDESLESNDCIDPDILPIDLEPWEIASFALCEELGFDPKIDVIFLDKMTSHLAEMYSLGMKQGRREAYQSMRSNTKALKTLQS